MFHNANLKYIYCLTILICSLFLYVWYFFSNCRKQLGPIIDACLGHLRLRLNKYLTTPLPSTGFNPHYSMACDKSTFCRTQNHGILILAPYKGERLAYPIGAPKVYTATAGGKLAGGTAHDLAVQLKDTLFEFALLTDSYDLSYITGRNLFRFF